MKLHFLGTCAGTEPMPGRKHASVAVEVGDRLYWFDAGEGCSYTAHLMGLDLLKIKAVFISHTHMDHVGGLENLFWNMRKISRVQKRDAVHGKVDLHIPVPEVWQAMWTVLRNTEGGFCEAFPIEAKTVKEGVLCDDGVMKVTALHNAHMKSMETDRPLAFSYLLECEGKRIIYSGDVASYEELDPLLGDGLDGLIMETGHNSLEVACKYVNDRKISRVFFTHNCRAIMKDPAWAKQTVQTCIGPNAYICEDGQTIEL